LQTEDCLEVEVDHQELVLLQAGLEDLEAAVAQVQVVVLAVQVV
jgi:hypothetical protein